MHAVGHPAIASSSRLGMTNLPPLKPAALSRGDWFRYVDRAEHGPYSQGMVVTSSFSHATVHEDENVGWEREEWDIRAVLVPLDSTLNKPGADTRAANSIHAHDLDFRPWWRAADAFDFGDVAYLEDVLIWPWLHHRVHRRTDQMIIEPRADFLRYHALDRRELPDRGGMTEYVHPLEESVALRTWVERVAFYDPTPFVEVQPAYLGDYLAARNATLLIAIVADRFAHAGSVSELELEPREQMHAGENAWITTTIHEQSPYNSEYAMGRSSLYWNALVHGRAKPQRSRSAWHVHDERRESSGESQQAPTFIVDTEGSRRSAIDTMTPKYLYFSLRVLDRYFVTPGYHAGFHMRTWGGATSPHGSVDVGVNSGELLTAFMPDIAKLPVQEQLHWALHSILPDGEVCWAMFETRMQNNPPHQPGVIDIIGGAFHELVDAVHSRFGVEVGDRMRDPPRGSDRLSIGPIHGTFSEVADLAMLLYAWVVEGIAIGRLQTILAAQSTPYEPSMRQFGLLRLVLTRLAGTAEAEAKRLLGPLDALNELRAKAAHVANADYAALLPRLGLSAMPATPRRYWNEVVEAVSNSLVEIASRIRSGSSHP